MNQTRGVGGGGQEMVPARSMLSEDQKNPITLFCKPLVDTDVAQIYLEPV